MSLGYIGSKIKLLPFLKEHMELYMGKSLKNVKSFLDGFSGSGAVSNFLIAEGCEKVISNDIQYYSFIICSVLTKNNLDTHKLDGIIQELNTINCSNPNKTDFIYANYTPNNNCERMYLTNENGIKVDRIRKRITELVDTLSFQEYHYLIKLLLYAVSKVSNTSSTYGAYLKQFKESAKKNLILSNIMLNEKGNTKCYNLDISILLDTVEYTEVFYMDSPYNSRNYSTNYFLLENIAKYDNPEIKGKTGLRVDTSTNSKFCSKVKAKNEFQLVLSKVNSKYIFISYSNESIVSKKDLMTILDNLFTNVICYEKEYKRFKSNNNGEQHTTVQEYLFAATNKKNFF